MDTFTFASYSFDKEEKKAVFSYEVSGEEETISFAEELIFEQEFLHANSLSKELLDNALQTLHLILGISYYKLYCPANIVVKTRGLTREQASFWDAVYTKGLGEFFYRNNINFKGLIKFPHDEVRANPIARTFSGRLLFGIGGGKDSIVAYELLIKAGFRATGLVVEKEEEPQLIKDVSEVMGVKTLKVMRKLDPKIYEKGALKGTYDGHIPISAVYGSVGVLAAILYDYSYVIVANERSSNYGNVEYLGTEINHQWSKSEEFEHMFQSYVKKYITPGVTYFSLLRPLSEIRIAKLFAQYPDYFSTFSSCNTNFKLNVSSVTHTRWCGNCPKCAFTFASLAAFLPKDRVVEIFGKDLFDDQALLPLFRSLLGIEGIKPFECVGTPDEVTVAFHMAHETGQYSGSPIMQMFEKEVLPGIRDIKKVKGEVFAIDPSPLLPEQFRKVIPAES